MNEIAGSLLAYKEFAGKFSIDAMYEKAVCKQNLKHMSNF